MATLFRKLLPGLSDLLTALNANKLLGGTLTDPQHNHAAGAITVATQTDRDALQPPAPGATIHAAIAGGGALNVSTAFTQMVPPTNVRLSRSGAGVATNYTVTGTRFGAVQTEVIASNGASDVEGVKIFDTITSLTSNVDPTVTTTVKTGVILGLARVASALLFLAVAAAGVNGVAETGTLNAAKDGITPTTAPDGTKVFQVYYQYVPTATAANTANAATSITTALGASTKYHLDASEVTVALADATDLPSLVALANQCLVVYQTGVPGGIYPGHRADTLAHKAADATNTVASGPVTDGTLGSAETLVGQLRTALNAHLTQAGVHVNNDTTTTIDATACDSLAHTITVANSLKAALNAHMANALPGASLRLIDD